MLKVKVISLPYIFQILYVLCFTNVKISGERLQDQWSSGSYFCSNIDCGHTIEPPQRVPSIYVLEQK